MARRSIYSKQEKVHICLCPLKGVIDVIGKKWALLIVNVIGNHGSLRTKEIMQELKISPRTFSDTVKDLEMLGLIKRESFNEIPPRVEYYLTQKGKKLREAIIPLLEWASSMTESGNFESCCKPNSNKLMRLTGIDKRIKK